MEEVLTNCLIKMQDDLNQLGRIREYLDSNPHSECQSGFSITWRIIEAFNTSLGSFKSDDPQQVEVLNVILDTFHYVSRNNNDKSVWKHFGFELGAICLKFLAHIEKKNNFEDLFCNLLSTIDIICEYTSDLWKALGRQIMNVFINKKFSALLFEKALELYISILRKTDDQTLYTFTQQNFHLVKTFFKIVQGAGDIEIQFHLMEAVFYHVQNDAQLMDKIIFSLNPKEKFSNSTQRNFDEYCRTYLNALNDGLKEEKKVFSINCKKLVMGGQPLEPPNGKNSFWLDANKSTKRLSTKFLHVQKGSLCEFVMFIQFVDVTFIHIEIQPNNIYTMIFRVNNLKNIFPSVKTDEVVCVANPIKNTKEKIMEFKHFLEENINRINYEGGRLSESCDQIRIDKNNFSVKSYSSGDNSPDVTSNERQGIDCIIPDALALITKMENENNIQSGTSKRENELNKYNNKNDSKSCEKNSVEEKPNSSNTNKSIKATPDSEDLSHESFIESLNKNLGLDSPSISNSFESSILSLKFQQNSPQKITHKLFRTTNTVFDFLDEEPVSATSNSIALMNKKESGETDNNKEKIIVTPKSKNSNGKCFELSDTQSDLYFCSEINKKKMKPTLPKLNRRFSKRKPTKIMNDNKSSEKIKIETKPEPEERPSLLDPNGYAYRRWLEPTTSERSKFWLKKLENLEKKRKNSDRVFEFTDDSDGDWQPGEKRVKKKDTEKYNYKSKKMKAEKKPKKQCRSKSNERKRPKRNAEQLKPSINSKEKIFKELSKKNESQEKPKNDRMKEKKNSDTLGNQNKKLPSCFDFPEGVPVDFSEDDCKKKNSERNTHSESLKNDHTINESGSDFRGKIDYGYNNLIIERGSSIESILNLNENESLKEAANSKIPVESAVKTLEINKITTVFSCAFDELEISDIDDENYISTEKPNFTNKSNKKNSEESFPLIPSNRLQNIRSKLKEETDEIILMFTSATTRFINLIQFNYASSIISYLKKAESVSSRLKEPDFSWKMKNIMRVYAYYKSKCSPFEFYESDSMEISTVKNKINCWTKKKSESLSSLRNFNGRLETLIEKEIDELYELEVDHFKKKIMSYASLFGAGFDEWVT